MIFLTLFIEFFKIGLFAIGGGLATLPFLYDLSAKYGWFTATELTNMIAISESTPGPIGINAATYAGYAVQGVPGAIVSTFGLVCPSLIIILLIAVLLKNIKDNPYVNAAFYGLRPAVCGLIVSAGYKIFETTLWNWPAFQSSGSWLSLFDVRILILFGILLWFQYRYNKHPILVILMGAAVGILLSL